MDEVLASVAETLKNFAVIYLVDITEVPDFNTMYELYDPSTIMFFFRNKHIMIDLGTGNNNKINWAMKDKQEFIDIVETVYRGARKGRGLVIAPKDYSTKYRYWKNHAILCYGTFDLQMKVCCVAFDVISCDNTNTVSVSAIAIPCSLDLSKRCYISILYKWVSFVTCKGIHYRGGAPAAPEAA